MHHTLIKSLNKRYATKQFDSNKNISKLDLDTLVEAVRLTATSYGLQLMKLLVINNRDPKNKKLKKELLKHSFNQKQVVDANYLFVLCKENTFSFEHINNYINDISITRQTPRDTPHLLGFKEMLKKFKEQQTEEQINHWMVNQVYIALGNLLTAAALLNIDTCPMEGFNAQKFDEILELDKEGLNAVLIVPIGYADLKDKYKTTRKVRRPKEKFAIFK
jgi:nitroreductase